MSAVSDAFAGLQTALIGKLTQLGQTDAYFAPDPNDSTSIKTTKNIKVIGSVTARDDILGNENIS